MISINLPDRCHPTGENFPYFATMSKKVTNTPGSHTSESLFGKTNYIWMLAGIAVIALGLILMAGGRSADPAIFEQKEVYSTTRITIAPILIIAGLALEVVAIFKKPTA